MTAYFEDIFVCQDTRLLRRNRQNITHLNVVDVCDTIRIRNTLDRCGARSRLKSQEDLLALPGTSDTLSLSRH